MTGQRVGDLLRAAAIEERTGWLAGERQITYAEMNERSDRIATGLLGLGVRHGDRIALNDFATPGWLAVYFAAAKIGAVVVGVSVRYRDSEIAHILSDSGARSVFTVPSAGDIDFLGILARTREAFPHLREVVSIGTGGDRTLAELEAVPPDAARLAAAEALVAPDDPVMIIYTSGTTGRPKGATLTHRGQLAAATAQARHMRLGPGDVLPVTVPLNHVSGITCCVLAALAARAQTALLPAFSPSAALQLLKTSGLTVWVGVPTMHTLLLDTPAFTTADTSGVRLVITGGANAEPSLLRRLTRAFPNATVMNLYGLSETSGAVVMTPWGTDPETTVRSIGRPLPGVQAKVVNTDGSDTGPGATGELLVRTPSVMAGYHGLPAETARTVSGDGWLHTGDMVRVDDGLLTLRGRWQEMFVQGGFNVYPVEVENVLAAHPEVVMAAGIGVPDLILGEIGCYYVVLVPGARTTPQDLKNHCAASIADYKVPKQIIIRTRLPLTPAGKVQKDRLRTEGAR
ncbi:class I adenylate-forming enzyme family protein [Actinomadura sp. 21ATH]|uniref:class I adenylate-forming enzyme family protein n=1 Tax=Actinomadura sp. 21ATH TaxID=1735444 RepID=UPI0035C00F86